MRLIHSGGREHGRPALRRPSPRPWTNLALLGVLVICAVAADCDSGSSSSNAKTLMLEPQNTSLLVGVNRISLALLDDKRRPVPAAKATLDVVGSSGAFETRPLENIGPEYGGIPIYVTHANLPQQGNYQFVVHATLKDGSPAQGQAYVTVVKQGKEVPVGAKAPDLAACGAERPAKNCQPVLSTPGATLAILDSGSPPDSWHDATLADGMAQHKPMVLFFGEPGFCKSQTCGPTVQILEQLSKTYGNRMLFEHIEDHFPAAPDETGVDNPAFDAFGLSTEPWVYMVNSEGIVSDRFEGPVTLRELQQSAAGTLAGKVPAVDVKL